MLNAAQIEELGWVKSASNWFLFESANSEYKNWALRVLGDNDIQVLGVRYEEPFYDTRYKDSIENQMELYDIMVDVGILPKED